ncbi:MAG TPA: COX aromatic rich motif-containing protein [Xanthobacteraceae bacterium]|nr:COX aromatic rich motif-containing protein [Xanthobacteraceae bacterium]
MLPSRDGAKAGTPCVVFRTFSGRVTLVSFLAAILAGCSGGVLEPKGPVGGANALILLDAVCIMCVIGVPTMIAVLVFAWWYRADNTRARRRPDFVHSGRIELLVWSIPILVIMFLGGVIWIGAHELDPFHPISALASTNPQEKPNPQPNTPPQSKTLEVQVVSLDWKWLFIYPDQGIASVNEIVVPVGTPVHFSITSASVMNMFFVPQLGSMIAAMNGMVTQLHLQADHPGDYYGLSSQYSGDGFSGMHFLMRAVPADEFARWVATTKAEGPTLDRAGYEQLAQQSQDVKPFTYRAIDSNIFHAVTTLEIAPGPGPGPSVAPPQVRPRGAD